MAAKRKALVWIYAGHDLPSLKVLVLKLVPERGGFWQPVTGKVKKSESWESGAAREASEETGFTFASIPERIGYEFEFLKKDKPQHEICFAVEVRGQSGTLPVPRLEPGEDGHREHTEYRWVKVEEALELVHHETNREALRRWVEKLRNEKGWR